MTSEDEKIRLIERFEKQILSLKEKEQGYEQVQRISNAILACTLRAKMGQNGELEIHKKDITEALKKYKVLGTETTDGFILTVTEI